MNLDELEQSLIQAARQGLGPSAADRERHQAELLSRLDGPAESRGERSLPGAGDPAAAPRALGSSGVSWRAALHRGGTSSRWLRAKLLGVGLVVGAVIGGLVGFGLGRGMSSRGALGRGSATEASSAAVGQEHGAGGEEVLTFGGSDRLRARLAAGAERMHQRGELKKASEPAEDPHAEGLEDDPVAHDLSSEVSSAQAARGAAPAASPRLTSRRHKRGAIATTKPESSLAIELAMLQRARRALNADNGRLALGLVQELDERFPDGILVEERSATRILSLCMLGRAEEARRFGGLFQQRYPGSVYAERVRESCIADVLE